MTTDLEDPEESSLHKTAKWDEVYAHALEKYKGDDTKAVSFVRGWFSAGEVMNPTKKEKAIDVISKPKTKSRVK